MVTSVTPDSSPHCNQTSECLVPPLLAALFLTARSPFALYVKSSLLLAEVHTFRRRRSAAQNQAGDFEVLLSRLTAFDERSRLFGGFTAEHLDLIGELLVELLQHLTVSVDRCNSAPVTLAETALLASRRWGCPIGWNFAEVTATLRDHARHHDLPVPIMGAPNP
jgi:hypothetical protein